MPKILVSLADEAERDSIIASLRLKKHDIVTCDPVDADDEPADVAKDVMEAAADVAILDYIDEDASSVKMMQAVTERPGATRFIFILPDDVPVSHILMAVNEGASALLRKPVNLESLANYVDRALSGPGRFRPDPTREVGVAAELSEIERTAKSMRMQLASYRKLIAFLLSTPVASQHRSALVVSDSAYQRDYLKKVLEDHGFLVHLAANPEEGLASALEEKPRIVISDLEMEGKNGIEFCRDLKITHKIVPCHFVICTANSEKVEEVMAPGNGVDACVVKPSGESGNMDLVAAAAMGLLL